MPEDRENEEPTIFTFPHKVLHVLAVLAVVNVVWKALYTLQDLGDVPVGDFSIIPILDIEAEIQKFQTSKTLRSRWKRLSRKSWSPR